MQSDAKKLAGSFNISGILNLTKDSNVFLALLGITLYGTGDGIFLTTMPAYLLQEKGFDATYIGVFFSLFYVAISISQVITGKLSDRFGPNIFMVFGLMLASLGLAITPFLDFIGILFMLTIASLGLGVFYLASMIFLNETVDESFKGTISGAYYLFWGIGMFFGPPSKDILDHMESEELAENLFRATQTEAKLRRDNIDNKTDANKTHFEIGKKIRKTIVEFGNERPENLPTPQENTKQLESRKKKELPA